MSTEPKYKPPHDGRAWKVVSRDDEEQLWRDADSARGVRDANSWVRRLLATLDAARAAQDVAGRGSYRRQKDCPHCQQQDVTPPPDALRPSVTWKGADRTAIVLMAPIVDGLCSGCGTKPSRETGSCRCLFRVDESIRQPVTPPPDALRDVDEAWEAMALDFELSRSRTTVRHYLALHRPRIEAALRAQGVVRDSSALGVAIVDLDERTGRKWREWSASAIGPAIAKLLHAQGVVQSPDPEWLARALAANDDRDLGESPALFDIVNEQRRDQYRERAAAIIRALTPVDESREPHV